MNFRQFAIFTIRLQALWLFFYAVIDATYLVDFLVPPAHFTLYARLLVVRVSLHLVVGILCLRYADRIVSWFVKDIVPRTPIHTTPEPDSPRKPD